MREPAMDRGKRVKWSIDKLHRLRGFVEKDVCTSLSIRGKLSSPLVTSGHRTCEYPENTLNDQVRDEPSDMRCCHPWMNIGSLKELPLWS